MDESSYHVTLRCGDVHLGAGFFITRVLVVTAAHCLQSISDETSTIDVVSSSLPTLRGRIAGKRDNVDLALIELIGDQAFGPSPPTPSGCDIGDDWLSRFRPSPSDPSLSGVIRDVDCEYKCEGGDLIKALQLQVATDLGDFSGYSGAPVERDHPSNDPTVVGMLLEQYPERGGLSRASNVLFAASIRSVLNVFPQFDVKHLYHLLIDDDPTTSPLGANAANDSSTTMLTKAEEYLEAFKEWYDRGYIDSDQLRLSREKVITKIIDQGL